jgi:hypothetical protein
MAAHFHQNSSNFSQLVGLNHEFYLGFGVNKKNKSIELEKITPIFI